MDRLLRRGCCVHLYSARRLPPSSSGIFSDTCSEVNAPSAAVLLGQVY